MPPILFKQTNQNNSNTHNIDSIVTDNMNSPKKQQRNGFNKNLTINLNNINSKTSTSSSNIYDLSIQNSPKEWVLSTQIDSKPSSNLKKSVDGDQEEPQFKTNSTFSNFNFLSNSTDSLNNSTTAVRGSGNNVLKTSLSSSNNSILLVDEPVVNYLSPKSPEELHLNLSQLLSITSDQLFEIESLVTPTEGDNEDELGYQNVLPKTKVSLSKSQESNILLSPKSPFTHRRTYSEEQVHLIPETDKNYYEQSFSSSSEESDASAPSTPHSTTPLSSTPLSSSPITTPPTTPTNVKMRDIIVSKSQFRKSLQKSDRKTDDQLLVISSLLKKLFDGISYSKIDMLIGLSLLNKYYKEYVIRNWDCETDREHLTSALRYSKFSTCAYGRKLYFGFIEKQAFGIMKSLVGSDSYNIKILIKHCQIEKKDIITSKWFSSKYSPGHYIALDHSTKALVVVIRGTFNHFDVVSDLVANSTKIKDGLAHTGILMCAHKKMQELQDIILKTLSEFPGYRLIITGHSLGAGVASILTLLFNEKHPHIPIHCFSYGVPCILTAELASYEKVNSLVSSFCMNDDIIPRLSFNSLFYLREVIDEICSQSHNKLQKLFQIASAGGKLSEKLQKRFSKVLKVSPVIDLSNVNHQKTDEQQIFPPGRVTRMVKLSKGVYVAERTQNKSYDKIIVSTTMFTDHMPHKYEKGLESSLENMDKLEYTKKPPAEEIIEGDENVKFDLASLNIKKYKDMESSENSPLPIQRSVPIAIIKNEDMLKRESITLPALLPQSLKASHTAPNTPKCSSPTTSPKTPRFFKPSSPKK